MKKMLLVVFLGVLQNFIFFVNAECNINTEVKQKSKDAEVKPLHHIIEFGKRDQIIVKDCIKKNHTNTKNSSKPTSVLGLHGLLHARSQKAKQQTGTRREDEPSRYETLIFEKPKERGGIKRTEDEDKRLHKLQLRTETIRMLHKIVEKYFPGDHLTVEQKIKALKILGKLIKLKKEGKNADAKAILDSFAKKSHNSSKDERAGGSALKTGMQEKVSESGNEISKTNEEDDLGGTHGGDIYATIANGPDMPKMPPTVTDKDSEHTHSNIMPVGFHSMDDGGGLMSSNDISDKMGDFYSERKGNAWPDYSNQQNPGASLGMGQMLNTDDNYYSDKRGLGDMPMMNGPADTRSNMPFSPRYRYRGSYDDEYNRRYDDDEGDDDDDDDDDDDEDNDGSDDEPGHTRSYVTRHGYDDDESDDDNVVEYRSRFNRKDKIAKSPKTGYNAAIKRKKTGKVPHKSKIVNI